MLHAASPRTRLLRRPRSSHQPSQRCLLSRRAVPSPPGARSLIFMHGLGDVGESWRGMLEDLLPGWRLQTPTAPIRPVTINGGARMPAWYDITGLNRNALEDLAGTEESRNRIAGLIESEIAAGVPSTSVFIGGFSQGGAMALWTGLQYRKPLGGVVSLSGYLPFAAQFAPSAENQATPVFVGHGDEDEVVSIMWSRSTIEALRAKGISNLETHEYRGMGHTVYDDELQDVLAFLQRARPRI